MLHFKVYSISRNLSYSSSSAQRYMHGNVYGIICNRKLEKPKCPSVGNWLICNRYVHAWNAM